MEWGAIGFLSVPLLYRMLFDELWLWRDAEPHPGPLNMALDEALLEHIERPVLRFYEWSRPAVSFGYFIPHQPVLAEWPDREPVRRWTGGGVVPHGEDFTYSLIVPREHPVARLTAQECYRAIHQAVASACGGSSFLAPVAAKPISAACFENPAESDVLEGERKIAGAAQRRTRRGLLHQGSVVLEQEKGQGRHADFAARLAAELAQLAHPYLPASEVLERAEALAAAKYVTGEWLHKF